MEVLEFSDLTPEGKKFFKELQELANLEVQVGFHEGSGSYDNGVTLAQVAAFNEFGSSHTPARPFMRQSFENHEDELRDACERVNNVLAKGGSARQALNELGVFARGLVQEEIVSGGFAPNAPSTVKQKCSDTPLVDTGFMRQSVNLQIKKG